MARRHPPGEELSSFLDGTLPTRRAAALERHMAGCERCVEDLRDLRAVRASLAGLPEAEARAGWLPDVAATVAAGGLPTSTLRVRLRRRVRLTGGLVAAAVAALAVALWAVPPPAAPVSFQDEVRRHLVQIDNPLADQTSYVVEVHFP